MGLLLNQIYPLGYFGIAFSSTLFAQWIVFARAGQSNLGLVLLISTLLQALLGPIAGWISDWSHRRLGARKWLIVAASGPLALSFYWIWIAKVGLASDLSILAYSCLFALVANPYFSLLGTITSDLRSRNRLGSLNAIALLLGTISASIGGALFLKHSSFIELGRGAAWILVGTLALPVFLLREIEPETETQNDYGWRALIAPYLKNRTARRFFSIYFLLTFVFTTITASSPFLANVFLGDTEAVIAWLNGWFILGMLFALPAMAPLTRRMGYGKLMRMSAAACALLLGTGWVVCLTPWSHSLVFWCASYFAFGPIVFVSMYVPPLILSQLTDGTEAHARGAYFGLNGFFTNAGKAFGLACAALLLSGLSTPSILKVQIALGVSAIAAGIAGVIRI